MRRYTALFFLIMFMIGTDTFLISPMLPTLQAEFGVSTEAAGWMLGAYTLGSAVFALIAGPLSDGWNRRTVLLGGLLGFSLSTFLCGSAEGFWTMCLFRFLAGISAAFTAPQVWASIPSVMPPARISKTMGIAFAGLAASQALGVPIGSWLAAAGWSVPFRAVGAASLLLAAAAYALLPDMKPAAGKGGAGSILGRYRTLLASGRARSGFLGYLLLHLGSGTAFAFAGKWLADRFALPIGQIGTVLMVLGIGTLLGSLLPAYAVRRLGRIPTMAAGMGLLIVLYPLLPYGPGLPLVTAGYLLIFAVLGVLFPIVMEALTSLNASVRGTISSLANSTMNGANTVGAWAAGLLYVRFGGYASIGLFAAVCLALSLGTFLLGGLFRERETGAEREAAAAS
ncbi:MFS transporter [Paenibacillus aurantius]|uniref:MFS transporter n=1 Tax=Paenibacillus aurantius TaxID=2918900 RepID=A0AA96RFH0_9BACL|nr:MFS transporter [Paenibacillus aurantius]WNQ11441.1 MFS transporter [Paenibacillus aurantius]